MKRLHLLALLAVLCLGFGALVSCDDDDDDDSGGDDDDDGGGDDDDNATGDTWTDSSSGLTWQVTPSSDDMDWEEAKAYCDNLSLAGGGWHLPTISELRTLIRGCDATETGGSCGVTDDCLDYDCQDNSCLSCEHGDGPNNGCYGPSELPDECDWYWSSSPAAGLDLDIFAWHVYFGDGFVATAVVDNDGYVRCVR